MAELEANAEVVNKSEEGELIVWFLLLKYFWKINWYLEDNFQVNRDPFVVLK